MGNVTSNDLRNPSTSGGGSRKVILWNGTVEEFSEPVTVAELMMEHPKQVVVEVRPDCITGKTKPSPLPADHNLDPNKLYLMLPLNKRSKPFSGEEEVRRLLMVANTSLRARSATGSGLVPGSRFLPLLVKVCAGPGMATSAVTNKFTVMKKKGGCGDGEVVVAVGEKWGPEVDDEYNCEGGSSEFLISGRRWGKGWKPSLDTIVEKEIMEKKVKLNHWLF